MDDAIIETWRINNRINLYLLDAISTEALSSLLPSSRTRTVARMFVHVHHMRISWLEVAAPDLLDGLKKFDKSDRALDKKPLHRALDQSGQAMAVLLEQGLKTGKIKGFQRHPIAFLGYLISHEAYHRGLRTSNHWRSKASCCSSGAHRTMTKTPLAFVFFKPSPKNRPGRS